MTLFLTCLTWSLLFFWTFFTVFIDLDAIEFRTKIKLHFAAFYDTILRAWWTYNVCTHGSKLTLVDGRNESVLFTKFFEQYFFTDFPELFPLKSLLQSFAKSLILELITNFVTDEHIRAIFHCKLITKYFSFQTVRRLSRIPKTI